MFDSKLDKCCKCNEASKAYQIENAASENDFDVPIKSRFGFSFYIKE